MKGKKPFRRFIVVMVSTLVIAGIAITLAVRFRYGGGTADFPDRTTSPVFSADTLETVADLSYPPGNLAVSRDGRIFFSLHPEGRPDIRVAELVNGNVVPYPSPDFQGPGRSALYFDSVLSVRICKTVYGPLILPIMGSSSPG